MSNTDNTNPSNPPDDTMTPDEIDSIRELARSLTLKDRQLDEPPASIWSAIEAELPHLGAPEQPVARPVADTDTALTDAEVNNIVPLRARRVPAWMPAVAAAVLLVAGLGLWFVASGDDEPNDTEVASVTIVNDELPVADDASGEARLVQDADGQYYLDLDVSDLDTDSGYLELWVIDTEVEGMHSLGTVDGDGTFYLPPEIDPADFPIVDISVEQNDGDVTHSGQSVLRGVLDISA